MTDDFTSDPNHAPQSPSDHSALAQDIADDLPPVQPPSAAFIVQLFVVPALIVLGVVAVWVLFGRIVTRDQDWRKLVVELQSPNTHIRNRAMYGLAEYLRQDRNKEDEGESLSSNPEIVKGLSEQLVKEFELGSNSNESISIQLYLTRALGFLDAPYTEKSSGHDQEANANSPSNAKSSNAATSSNLSKSPASLGEAATITITKALVMSLDSNRDIEIRKSGAASIAFIAGRAAEGGRTFPSDELLQAVLALSIDRELVLRQTAAFTLGLFPSPAANQQLQVLLENDDWMTQVNAAIALARHGSTQGLPVFKKALSNQNAANPNEKFEQLMILKNSLVAIKTLTPHLQTDERNDLQSQISSLIKTQPDPKIRSCAQDALDELSRNTNAK
ncbi:MAG: hypothetical protein FJ267_10565 [Planctomycetes bacterium]|nr:hypothetical protein [Planctomycetota bacterium]